MIKKELFREHRMEGREIYHMQSRTNKHQNYEFKNHKILEECHNK
jgi:hypothetical protein